MIDLDRVLSSDQLPTLPTVAARLLELRRDPNSELKDFIATLRLDPAICAKLLKLANSSHYAVRMPVATIDRAIPLLGTTVVTSMALGFSLSEAAIGTGPLAPYYRDYWRQSVIQAIAVEELSNRAPQRDRDAFLVGLLMDIGRLAMLKTIPDAYRGVLELAPSSAEPLHMLERAAFGFDHVEVGVELMQRWRLPDSLVDSIWRQHADVAELKEVRGDPGVVEVAAAALAGECFCAPGSGDAVSRLRVVCALLANFGDADQEQWLEATRARFESQADLFNTSAEGLPNPLEMLSEANAQLSQMVMCEHLAGAKAEERSAAIERDMMEFEHRSLFDPLTKLYNRRYFEEALGTEVRRCRRRAEPIGLVFADIDKFKNVNDTYGHPFGDQVLRQVAAAFEDVIRASDVLARYGGEEFVLMANQPTKRGLLAMAERVRKNVAAAELHAGADAVRVTISLGAAIAMPGRNESDVVERLLAAADSAMYEAKRRGGDQVVIESLMDEWERYLLERVRSNCFSCWLVQRGHFDQLTMSRALLQSDGQTLPLGELATNNGHLTSEQVNLVLQAQEDNEERFGAAAVRLGFLTEDQLVHLLSLQREDPVQLARTLVRLKMTQQRDAVQWLRDYLHEFEQLKSSIGAEI